MDGVIASDEETFAHMYQEVRRLRRLVDDLQSLSKVEAGHISLNVTTFDLIALVKKVVEQLQPQATAQALQMSTTCVSSAMIQADADRTAQILLNLIGNAIRYTAENGQITVHCSLKHRNVEVSIEDTGIGIPPEALPYIFERFYRVDPSRSRSSGGSGIGLTISRHLTWAMRGELTAHSNGLGHGTIFLLKLPLAEEFLAL
ncbi:MAG: HAMP domain-containing sensor histidine kinase [Chloroflexota bacterium]